MHDAQIVVEATPIALHLTQYPITMTGKAPCISTGNNKSGQATIGVLTFGMCSKDLNSMKSENPNSGFYEDRTSRTLDCNSGNPTCNQGGIVIVEQKE